MSIPMSKVEYLKDGKVVGAMFSWTVSYGTAPTHENGIAYLKRAHKQLQEHYEEYLSEYFQKILNFSLPPKDYDGLRVRWINGDIITYFLTGEGLVASEVLKESERV